MSFITEEIGSGGEVDKKLTFNSHAGMGRYMTDPDNRASTDGDSDLETLIAELKENEEGLQKTLVQCQQLLQLRTELVEQIATALPPHRQRVRFRGRNLTFVRRVLKKTGVETYQVTGYDSDVNLVPLD
jgi:hypothetical protein